jgi:hypothetical protein
LDLIAGLVPPGQMLIRKAQTSKKVQLNVDSVSHWMATNNARDNLKKRDYFERFGIADGLRRLAEDFPFRPRTLAGQPSTPTPRSHCMNRKLIFIASPGLAWRAPSLAAVAQDASARTVQYHSQDIVPIRAKVKYTTLIEVPPTEKIMEAATGDKDFWIVDVVGNFCFVHPAKARHQLQPQSDHRQGQHLFFTLQDVSGTPPSPDLKVIIEPADRSSIVAASGPPQFVPAAQLEQSKQQLAALQSHVEQAVDEYKSATRCSSSSTTPTRPTKRPSIFSRSITTTSSPTSRPMRRRSSACTR